MNTDGLFDQSDRPSAEQIEQQLEKAKALILEHPLASAGAAFALGALIGLLRPRGKGGIVRAAIGGIAMGLMRDALVRRVSTYANHWIDVKSREESMSRQRATEAFMEH